MSSNIASIPSRVSQRKHNATFPTVADRDTGRTLVNNDNGLPTYSVAFSVALAASATDVVEIIGSATKRVEIKRILIGGVQTTAGQVIVDLIRRSTAATGGTSTSPTIAKHAVADAAATAVVKAYTANPTVGTAAGTLRTLRLPIPTATGVVPPVELVFGAGHGKPVVLAAATQTLCLNLKGNTVTGGTLDVVVEFTESSLT